MARVNGGSSLGKILLIPGPMIPSNVLAIRTAMRKQI